MRWMEGSLATGRALAKRALRTWITAGGLGWFLPHSFFSRGYGERAGAGNKHPQREFTA
jgi:hypothetical protein